MTQSSKFLLEIQTKSAALLKAGRPVLCVYDLDSTLFDVQPRTERILRDFAALPEIMALDPATAALLRDIKTQHSDWGIRNAIERAGLHRSHPELVEKARAFWVERFFANDYLKYDVPVPGALEFVKKMRQLGADHVYLTGRHRDHMHSGSVEVLKHWGFPLGDEAQELVMKTRDADEDFAFKERWFLGLEPNKYGAIWFFENEPINLTKVKAARPEVQTIFFDSTHSGRHPVPAEMPAIKHFI